MPRASVHCSRWLVAVLRITRNQKTALRGMTRCYGVGVGGGKRQALLWAPRSLNWGDSCVEEGRVHSTALEIKD